MWNEALAPDGEVLTFGGRMSIFRTMIFGLELELQSRCLRVLVVRYFEFRSCTLLNYIIFIVAAFFVLLGDFFFARWFFIVRTVINGTFF